MYCFKSLFFVGLFVLTFVGCKQQTNINNTESLSVGTAFFDLENQINSDIIQLKAKNLKLKKTVIFDNKPEALNANEPNWEIELLPLKNLNINKPLWYDKYEVDSVIIDDALTIKYTSKTPSIQVKFMQIKYDSAHKVTQIDINSSTRNILFNSKKHITYKPLISFTIKGNQKALFLVSHNFEIWGEMIQGNE